MNRKHRDNQESARHGRHSDKETRHGRSAGDENQKENPPRTTTSSWLTTPKFGSSTSGGGEIEPGPERD